MLGEGRSDGFCRRGAYLSHLDPKKQVLHRKLSSTGQLDGLYRFEYYDFLFESGDLISEMADLCVRLLHSLNNQV